MQQRFDKVYDSLDHQCVEHVVLWGRRILALGALGQSPSMCCLCCLSPDSFAKYPYAGRIWNAYIDCSMFGSRQHLSQRFSLKQSETVLAICSTASIFQQPFVCPSQKQHLRDLEKQFSKLSISLLAYFFQVLRPRQGTIYTETEDLDLERHKATTCYLPIWITHDYTAHIRISMHLPHVTVKDMMQIQ